MASFGGTLKRLSQGQYVVATGKIDPRRSACAIGHSSSDYGRKRNLTQRNGGGLAAGYPSGEQEASCVEPRDSRGKGRERPEEEYNQDAGEEGRLSAKAGNNNIKENRKP